ncbi:MAG: hypothetical protein JNJ48_07830 [Phycisphaerae bacterium]|nr:hypothetical protein [Phycisphaerae bacterium]
MIMRRPDRRGAAAGRSCREVAEPLAALLRELADVLHAMDDEDYTRRMGPLFAGATVGGHVRHTLDHVRALVRSVGGGGVPGPVDYDHRERGTPVETDRVCALEEAHRLGRAVSELAGAPASRRVAVRVMPTSDGAPVTLGSTLARELSFVLSHTVHHHATLRGMATALGRSVPEAFGYAPSTLAHMEHATCAR